MKLREVITAQDWKVFLDMPSNIYDNTDQYIRPLDNDIKKIFSEKNNLLKRGGKYILWILENDQNKCIGRVAAFVNPKYKNEQPTGGLGFFECIQNQDAANILFDTCKEWHKKNGMEAMDGSINFGERDQFWGLLVEGFQSPIYGMNYAKPYYKDLFEAYGFKVYFHQYCYGIPVDRDVPQKFQDRYAIISKDKSFYIKNFGKNDGEAFADAFCTVYNAAWASHGGGKDMEKRMALKIFKSMKPIIDKDLIVFAFHNDEPAGMWINIPDINGIMKKFNGKFGLIQKLQFLYLLKRKSCTRAVGIIFGIVPKFQSMGIDSLMIIEGAEYVQKKSNYKEYEIQWIGDFNPKMQNIAINLESVVSRKLSTYRFLFDREKEFIRHKIL